MFRALLVFGLAVVCLGSPLDGTKGSKVVGGQVALDGQFPFIVSIRVANYNAHTCGGSIIAPQWILTAAHCIYNNPERLTVVTGTNYLHQGGQVYDVISGIYHEGFNLGNFLDDIALLKVAQPIVYGPNVQPIQISPYKPQPGSGATVIGWGKTDANAQLSEVLRYFSGYHCLDTISCQPGMPNPITDSQICAFDAPGEGSCNGDSGGPLIDESGNLAGVVSWGIPCAIGAPDVYTSTTAYAGWINQVMSTN